MDAVTAREMTSTAAERKAARKAARVERTVARVERKVARAARRGRSEARVFLWADHRYAMVRQYAALLVEHGYVVEADWDGSLATWVLFIKW